MLELNDAHEAFELLLAKLDEAGLKTSPLAGCTHPSPPFSVHLRARRARPASEASYASEASDEPRSGEEPVPEATH